MQASPPYPPISGPIIQRVTLVDRISRAECSPFKATSLPGHLLHLVLEGKVVQTSGGRLQKLSAGEVVWYYEDEGVSGKILQAPWTFYTVNFEAPMLPPPPEHKRVRRVKLATAAKFEALLDAWRSDDRSSIFRHMRVHAVLLELLLDLVPLESGHRIETPTQPWWNIEARLRGKLDEQIDGCLK